MSAWQMQEWTLSLSNKELKLLIESLRRCLKSDKVLGSRMYTAVCVTRITKSQISVDRVLSELKSLGIKSAIDILHVSEIIGYCSTNSDDSKLFKELYKRIIKMFKMKPESAEAMHYRLADEDERVYVRSVLRRCKDTGKYYLLRLNRFQGEEYSEYMKGSLHTLKTLSKEDKDFIIDSQCEEASKHSNCVEINKDFIYKYALLPRTTKRKGLERVLKNIDASCTLSEKLYYLMDFNKEDEYYIDSNGRVRRR